MPSAAQRFLATAGARAAATNPNATKRRRRRKKDFGEAALETALDIGAGAVRPVLTGLEYLSRPWSAVVEGYGAAESGRDVSNAAMRILKGGLEKARYPTIGERVVPEQEGEGTGRMLARLGVDMATDPTMWLGPGAAKGVMGGVAKTARVLGETRALKAIGRGVSSVARSGPAQEFARAVVPTLENLSYYGKEAGAELGTRLQRALVNTDAAINPLTADLARKAKELGLAGNEAKLAQAAKMVERGVFRGSGDEGVDLFAQHIDDVLKGMGRKVMSTRDDAGRGIEITRRLTKKQSKAISAYGKANKLSFRNSFDDLVSRNALFNSDGSKVIGSYAGKKQYTSPFEMLPRYFPQYFKRELAEKSMSNAGMSEAVKQIMARMRIPEEQARRMLLEQTGRPVKAGHIEYGRVSNIPDDLRDMNPLTVLPRYLRETNRRLEMGKEFDFNFDKLDKLVTGAQGAGLSDKTGTAVINQVRGIYEKGAWDKALPWILGAQVVTKMGPASTIAQFSQNALSVVKYGAGNFAKGVTNMITSSQTRRLSAETLASALEAQLGHLAGASASTSLPAKWLKGVGFTWADGLARRLAFAAGDASAQGAARKAIRAGLGATKELKAMGVDDVALRFFDKFKRFPPDVARRIGYEAAETTQFLNRFTDLPPLWQTPAFRMATQYKSFAYQMSRFLMKDVMSPAMRYFNSGGKKGSVAPLLRALVTLPAAGAAVAEIRELMAETAAGVIGAKRSRKRKFDYKHPVAQMLQDSLYVGSFGIAGDAFQQAARGNFIEFMMGPTAADVGSLFEFGAQTVTKGELPSGKELGRRVAPHVPFRRVIPLRPQEISDAAMRFLR